MLVMLAFAMVLTDYLEILSPAGKPDAKSAQPSDTQLPAF
jgi:hypothetical protein